MYVITKELGGYTLTIKVSPKADGLLVQDSSSFWREATDTITVKGLIGYLWDIMNGFEQEVRAAKHLGQMLREWGEEHDCVVEVTDEE